MSAGQKLLPRRSLTEQFVPLVSARVPLFRPATGCLRGRDRRSRIVAANPPDHTFTIASNCKRDGQKNPDANARFLPYLTIFRMNTCTKKVGGVGVPILNSYSNSAQRNARLGERVGVQLHPPRDCATVRLKVQVRTSREAAVPCAHL
jgi:hypothetical protein